MQSCELLLVALPAEIRNMALIAQEIEWGVAIKKRLEKKKMLSFGSFIVLFATLAMQV
jgi:hypothetical protein